MCASRLISRKWLYRSGMYSWNSKLISFRHKCSCSAPTQGAHKSDSIRPKKSHTYVFLETSSAQKNTYHWHSALFSSSQTSPKEESPKWWEIFGKTVFLSKLWNVWESFTLCYEIPRQSASEPWRIFLDWVHCVKGPCKSHLIFWVFMRLKSQLTPIKLTLH